MLGWLLVINTMGTSLGSLPLSINSVHALSSSLLAQMSHPRVAQASDRMFYEQGRTKAAHKDYLGAIADFDRAIQLNAQNGPAYFQRGLAHYKLGQKQRAIEDYTQSLEHGFKQGTVYLNRGIALREMGHNQKAIADFNKARQTFSPGFNRRSGLSVLYHRGLARYNLADYPGAIQDLSPFLSELSPDDAIHFVQGYYDLGVAQSHGGDRALAIQNLQTALKLYAKLNDQEGYRQTQTTLQKLQSPPK